MLACFVRFEERLKKRWGGEQIVNTVVNSHWKKEVRIQSQTAPVHPRFIAYADWVAAGYGARVSVEEEEKKRRKKEEEEEGEEGKSGGKKLRRKSKSS